MSRLLQGRHGGERVRAAYDMLRTFPPFNRWKLPAGNEVEFRISRNPILRGAHTTYLYSRDHIIEISEKNVGHLQTLLKTLAHEMVHAAQAEAKDETPNAEHNADFHARAAKVCAVLGFDPKEF